MLDKVKMALAWVGIAAVLVLLVLFCSGTDPCDGLGGEYELECRMEMEQERREDAYYGY